MRVPLVDPRQPPRGPFRVDFWRSPLRGPWLTAVLGLILLIGLPIVIVTGLLSNDAYQPGLGANALGRDIGGPLDLYLFEWPTRPSWPYALTQGLHVSLGLALTPVVLAKLWSVIPRLLAAESDVVCFMDCDGSLDPRELRRVTDPVLQGAADLLGARIPEPGAWPWHARFANRVLALELRRRTGATLTDLGPMRAARREPLLALGLRDRGSGWPLEMVVRAAAENWRIAEVGVIYRARTGGRSKVSGSIRGTARAVRDMSAQLS